ncbi:helix-turn-helix transcriptional regulator [Microbacterium resistens]|uniref:Helix-turn-helix transcriptional regulator n=1 Tax=Microbacterium resistens TaxID=156977 RepID=A0ABY3RZP1_9MICO|nr:helix-turn-helix transcriptional regulator [Microbacterium resistens]UGS28376.1 helix-turn-helix transcriptional regulator [Microbacterium resistens]
MAPHVAGQLAVFADGDSVLVEECARLLSAEQLRGDAVLPDPLPLPPNRRVPILKELSKAQRRLLLFFALDPAAPVLDVVDAAGADVDLLFASGLSGLLSIDGGQPPFAKESVRACLLRDATEYERRSALDALARVAKRRGRHLASVAHRFAAHPEQRHALAGPLLTLADDLLAGGDAAGAYRAARAAAAAAGSARAWGMAAIAAFWCGAFEDARHAAQSALDTTYPQAMADVIDTMALLRSGPDGAFFTEAEATQMFSTLEAVARSHADLRLVVSLRQVYLTAHFDPRSADVLHARVLLGGLEADELSPLAEALLVVSQLTALILDGRHEHAASLLIGAAGRLPLVRPWCGLVIRYAQACLGKAGIDNMLVQAFADIGPAAPFSEDRTSCAPQFQNWPTPLAAKAVLLTPAGVAVDATTGLPPSVASLSARQQDVLDLVLQGLSNREIATRLALSPRTVEVHVTKILRRFGVSTRLALVALHAAQAL